jgi:hypothetical protein
LLRRWDDARRPSHGLIGRTIELVLFLHHPESSGWSSNAAANPGFSTFTCSFGGGVKMMGTVALGDDGVVDDSGGCVDLMLIR